MTARTLQGTPLQTLGETLSSPAADRPHGHWETASILDIGNQTLKPELSVLFHQAVYNHFHVLLIGFY
ncbi:hypothetical protein, partial [Klebsiella pneumoniae]|uniref:hypothetical protein n=1 Tax=Klebsiella pneumoniae TaxID=573 RepID=UPI0040557137